MNEGRKLVNIAKNTYNVFRVLDRVGEQTVLKCDHPGGRVNIHEALNEEHANQTIHNISFKVIIYCRHLENRPEIHKCTSSVL